MSEKNKDKVAEEQLENTESVEQTEENTSVEETQEAKKEDASIDETKNAEEKETEENKTKAEEKQVEEKKVSELEELGLKLSAMNDKYLRLSAEYDNYRKRTLKERMELMKSAGEGLLKGLLPVVDDFDRALVHLKDATDLDSVREGIDLIYNKFQEFLKRNGVAEIEAVEKDFDTDIHEAVTKIPAPDKKLKGKVVDCIEKGYKLNDKVIRFAKVVVGE